MVSGREGNKRNPCPSSQVAACRGSRGGNHACGRGEKLDPLGRSACTLFDQLKGYSRVSVSDGGRRANEIFDVKMYVARLISGDDEAPLLCFWIYELDLSFHGDLLLPDNAGE